MKWYHWLGLGIGGLLLWKWSSKASAATTTPPPPAVINAAAAVAADQITAAGATPDTPAGAVIINAAALVAGKITTGPLTLPTNAPIVANFTSALPQTPLIYIQFQRVLNLASLLRFLRQAPNAPAFPTMTAPNTTVKWIPEIISTSGTGYWSLVQPLRSYTYDDLTGSQITAEYEALYPSGTVPFTFQGAGTGIAITPPESSLPFLNVEPSREVLDRRAGPQLWLPVISSVTINGRFNPQVTVLGK